VKVYENAYTMRTLILKENKNKALNPNWLTGFADAESSFIISVLKAKDVKLS